MCSDFLHTMENFQGDLADIFRPNSGTSSSQDDHLPSIATAQANLVLTDWNLFQSSSSSTTTTTDPILMETPLHNFGHPFNSIGDPLLEDLDMSTGGPNLYCSSTTTNMGLIAEGLSSPFGGRKVVVDDGQDHHLHHHPDHHQRPPHNQNSRNHNLFSRMLQISPNNIKSGPSSSSSSAASPSLLLSNNDMINVNTSSKGCLVENTGLQISSPRNTGIKRRKSQAKKVVCIPAPAPVNSRPTGEVVPSDLWAWRKYGQKPIKGSPYPRGYYRCSSSKGCSARKQVERSRTDPNMLVITYTSEHNHPWPTQRNALAGSTRNQPSKTTISSSSKTSPPRPSQSRKEPSLKEEQKDLEDTNMILSGSHNTENMSSPVGIPSMGRQPVGAPLLMEERRLVKEEREDDQVDKEMEMDDDEDGGGDLGFPPSYRPALPDSNNHHHHHNPDQDFFADLGEIEADPLNHLLFSQGFSGVEERENSNKSLDPFSFYDWAATGNHNNNNSNNSSTFGTEAKRLGGL